MPDRLKLTVPLASWCSLRFGEIVELRRGDIDLEAEVIRVRRGAAVVKGGWVIGGPKTPAGLRDVSDPPHLLQMIDDHLANYVAAEPDSLLFPARLETPLEHLPWGWLHYRWKLTRKVAGREDSQVSRPAPFRIDDGCPGGGHAG